MHGFSVHYAKTIGNNKNKSKMITGAPKHEVIGTVQIKGQRTAILLPTIDDLTQFGIFIIHFIKYHHSKIVYFNLILFFKDTLLLQDIFLTKLNFFLLLVLLGGILLDK